MWVKENMREIEQSEDVKNFTPLGLYRFVAVFNKIQQVIEEVAPSWTLGTFSMCDSGANEIVVYFDVGAFNVDISIRRDVVFSIRIACTPCDRSFYCALDYGNLHQIFKHAVNHGIKRI